MRSQQAKYDLDELYPDEAPRREDRRLVIVHEFGTPVTNRQVAGKEPGVLGAQRKPAGASRISCAWLALRMLLMVLGGVVSIAYVAALPRFLQFAAVGVATLVFFLLYAMVRNVQQYGQHGR